jgi:hypothetical protein
MPEDNYPRMVSDPEAEGLPGTADDDSDAYDDVDSPRWADGADPAPLPGDSPAEVDRYGTTPEEALDGESLDYKLARERFDGRSDAPDAGDAPSRGDAVDTGDEVTDRPDRDAGLADDYPLEPDDSPVSLYDRPDVIPGPGRPVGRLVDPDEGGLFDDEKDMVGYDAGAAGGGASAEELAMHEVDEP